METNQEHSLHRRKQDQRAAQNKKNSKNQAINSSLISQNNKNSSAVPSPQRETKRNLLLAIAKDKRAGRERPLPDIGVTKSIRAKRKSGDVYKYLAAKLVLPIPHGVKPCNASSKRNQRTQRSMHGGEPSNENYHAANKEVRNMPAGQNMKGKILANRIPLLPSTYGAVMRHSKEKGQSVSTYIANFLADSIPTLPGDEEAALQERDRRRREYDQRSRMQDAFERNTRDAA